jgi:predicted nucleic acid-binding protein
MKLYIDTDVIIDFLYNRPEHYENSVIIFSLIENGTYKGYISSLIIWNLYYILSKYLNPKEARKRIKEFRSIIEIISIDGKTVDLALNSNIKDFEDSIQYYAAKGERVDILITRNKKDYQKGSLSIMTPTEFIKSIPLNS